MQRVALSLDRNRKNFLLKSVVKNSSEIGITNGQEWYNTELDPPTLPGAEKTKIYFVKICVVCNGYDTYRQNVLFYFGEYPAMLQRLCMDCVPVEEISRINDASNYQFSQIPKTWITDGKRVLKFESPFVPPKDRSEGREIVYDISVSG